MKYITGFFAFWYDFIVGDAWEVAAGVLLSLLAVYGAVHLWGASVNAYAVVFLPLVIVALLIVSLWRVRNST